MGQPYAAITEEVTEPIPTRAPTDPEMVRFAHPHLSVMYKTPNGVRPINTRMTIAYKVNGPEITYQVAYCSPNDNFSKATGRAKSAARLNAVPLTLQYDGEKVVEALVNYITNSPRTNSLLPQPKNRRPGHLPAYWLEVNEIKRAS